MDGMHAVDVLREEGKITWAEERRGQGLNLRTGAVAAAIWVNHSDPHDAVVFLHIDGEALAGAATNDRTRVRTQGG